MTKKTFKNPEAADASAQELTAQDLDKVSGGLVGDDVGILRGDKLTGGKVGAVKTTSSIGQPEPKSMERVHEDE